MNKKSDDPVRYKLKRLDHVLDMYVDFLAVQHKAKLMTQLIEH